ncbi:hypothetical protein [Methylobacterium nigriterrae]|uniref:hypothetical protein n=1 Tax=Methylobacterium nigriterrae TaxID=3127512 RepID=UPI00301359DB
MDSSRKGRLRAFRNRHLGAALAAGALCLGLSGAASAQYVYDDEILPPRAVAWRLSERGFSGMSRPRFDGRDYVVEAFGPNGARLRLFVDARDGAIVGRQRLDPEPYGPARVARPMPGYGWTEEDADPRRPVRQAERLVPPADIPMPGGRAVSPRPELYGRAEPARPGLAARPAEPNPLGLNPDAKGRAEAPRRVTRLAPPRAGEPKPAATRTAPGAPAPKLKPAETADHADAHARDGAKADKTGTDASGREAARPEAKPGAPVAAAEPPKPAASPTPASVQPPADRPQEARTQEAKAPEAKAPEAKAPEAKPQDAKAPDTAETRTAANAAEAKPPAQAWKDPPAEGKRNVRVIGGATIVPGGTEKEGAGAE